MVEKCVAFPGYEVFKCCDKEGEVTDVKSRALNAYVKEVIGEVFMQRISGPGPVPSSPSSSRNLGLPRT